MACILEFFFGSVEKNVGKKENADNQHFLLFSMKNSVGSVRYEHRAPIIKGPTPDH